MKDEADPDETLLDTLIPVRIVRLAEIISRAAARTFEPRFGLRNTDLRILVVLADVELIAIADLARRTKVDKAWISRSLGELVKKGLVGKRPDPKDVRVSRVFATAAARALLKEAAPVAFARQALLLKGLDEAEVRAMLDTMLANAQALMEQP